MKRMVFLTVVMLFSSTGILAASESTHWDYDGLEGPKHWGALAEKYFMCSEGQNQSPIDLVADLPADLPELVFEYYNLGGLIEENTGHAIQESVKPGNSVIMLGKKFELKQFHFHSPSEHTVNGKTFPMEVHLVHQNDKSEYFVVGLLFKTGNRNKIIDQLPSFKKSRGEDPDSDPIDYNDLVTERKDYFLYNGSLTTPPCTEGVLWIVMKQPIIVSSEQIQHYRDLLGFNNNRPIQPHNSRIVLE